MPKPKNKRKMTAERVKSKLRKAVSILNEITDGIAVPVKKKKNAPRVKKNKLVTNFSPGVLTIWQPFCHTEERPFGKATSDPDDAQKQCDAHEAANPNHVTEALPST